MGARLVMAVIILPIPIQSWLKAAENPVLTGTRGTWDKDGVSRPGALMGDDGNLFLYYTGFHFGAPEGIGVATSTRQYDRVLFTKYSGNPILTPTPGSWDENGALSPVVVHPPGGGYTMYYEGDDGTHRRILRATSTGNAYGPWVKQGIALDNGVYQYGGTPPWDYIDVYHPTVIYDPRSEGAVWRMWYAGYDGTRSCIGYATSPDGVVWAKTGTNPVFCPSGSEWDNLDVRDPTVVKIGGLYWMYYVGLGTGGQGIGSAFSLNGWNWTRWGNFLQCFPSSSCPAIYPGAAGSWEVNVFGPSAVPLFTWFWESSLYLGMYYTGSDDVINHHDAIGYAWASFGLAGSPRFMDAEQGGTYFINGDPSVSQYTAYDSLSAGILYGLCRNPQLFGFDTSASWVTQTGANRGALLLDGRHVVTMGGYGSNFLENYYENTAAATPVHARLNTATNMYEFVHVASGTVVASIAADTDFSHHDLVVIMTVYPWKTASVRANDILIIYGISWRGTWAGGIYFKEVLWGSSATWMHIGWNYAILTWNDTNGDTYPTANEISFDYAGS